MTIPLLGLLPGAVVGLIFNPHFSAS